MNATENNHNNNVTAGEGSSAAAANGGVGGGGGSQAQTEAAPGIPADVDPLAAAAAAPTSKKETSLREFLGKMDDYAPIVSFFFLLYFSSSTVGTFLLTGI